MNGSGRDRAAQRKSLLLARSELERLQIALTVHELRERMVPERRPGGTDGASRPARIAAAVVAIGVPLLGRHRLGRVLRGLSLAMTAARVVRRWRR